MKKNYPLRTILTINTSWLLTKPKEGDNGIGDLYEILEHMTGDTPFTHSLGRFAEDCKPHLLTWFPELIKADISELDLMLKLPNGIDEWLHRCESE